MIDSIRFWHRVKLPKMIGANECWEWLGAKSGNGYGGLKIDGRMHLAHRVSYELSIGPIQKGLCCLHKCDNPSCVNPTHLWLGTHADNTHDMLSKGRQAIGNRQGAYTHPEKRPKGERHGRHKLTEQQVKNIRMRYAEGGITHRQLAEENNVTHSIIGDILRRRNWKHL